MEPFEPGLGSFAEGEPAATCLYILLDGELGCPPQRRRRRPAHQERHSAASTPGPCERLHRRGRPASLHSSTRRDRPRPRFFVLDADDFAQLMRDWFPMAMHLLEGLFFGMRNTQQPTGQRERLLALGSLSAGLDPRAQQPGSGRRAGDQHAARARRRDAPQVGPARRGLRPRGPGDAGPAAGRCRRACRESARARPAGGRRPRGRARRLARRPRHLGAAGISRRRSSRPGSTLPWLEQLRPTAAGALLEGAMRWLTYSVETEVLMGEIEDAIDPHLRPSSRRRSSTPSWTGHRIRSSTSTSCSTARC